MISGRNISSLFKGLGGDPSGFQGQLLDTILPVYILGNYTRALQQRGSAYLYMHLVPSTVVARFSTIEARPHFGMWIRRFNCLAGNAQIAVNNAVGGSVAFPDASPQCLFIPPEERTGLHPQSTSLVSNYVVPPSSFTPGLFEIFDEGTMVGSVNGIFMPAGTTSDVLKDVWIPRGTSLLIQAVTQNTAISVALELEFPAEALEGF